MGRGEGCGYTLHSAQDSPPQRRTWHPACLPPPAQEPSAPGSVPPAPRLPQETGTTLGFLLTLFLDFSCLSCFPLETCWLHVHAGKRRHVQPKTTHRPSAHPPDPHRLDGHRTDSAVLPTCRQDRPRTGRFGSETEAAARRVEVSGSGDPAERGLVAHGHPFGQGHLGCTFFWFGSMPGNAGTQHHGLASARSAASLVSIARP